MNGLFKIVSILFFFVNIQACASENKPDGEGEERHAVLISGYYVYGHEVNAIQPCGSKKSYWVMGSDEILHSMAYRYEAIADEPYEMIFVRVAGEYLAKATDGFAADYDGRVLVRKIIIVTKGETGSCDPEEMK